MEGSSTGRVKAGSRRRAIDTKRELFLAHFAANCNVVAAAGAAGVPVPKLYRWRQVDPDFAERWSQALAIGYETLEARLVAHALAGSTDDTIAGVADTPIEPLYVEMGMRLLGQRKPGVKQGGGRPLKKVAREDMLAVLLKRIELIEKRKRTAAAQADDAQRGAP